MGVPKLRFKADDGSDFPDWTFRTFGSVVEEFNDRTTTENEDVLLSCAIDGIYLNSELFGHQRGASNIGYKKITKGALILSMQNLHLGNANVNTRFEHGIVSPAYKTFHIVGCLTEFMSAWVKRHAARKFFYDATTVGASQCRRNVDWEELYQQTIAVPSPSEQHKIADLLSAVDDVISAQEAEVAAWEKRKKGVMQKLFSQEVRFKADDGSDFPDWKEKTLGNLGTFLKGAPLSKSDITDEGTPLILYGELYTTYAEVAYSIARRTDKKVPDKFYSKVGDVVIPTSGETPEEISTATCVMKDGVILAGDLYIYRPATNVDGRILSYLLNHQVNNAISRIAQGKSVVHVQSKELERIHVIFPSSPIEQRKIADCLASLDDVIIKAKNELAKWQELKKGLLQQMFV